MREDLRALNPNETLEGLIPSKVSLEAVCKELIDRLRLVPKQGSPEMFEAFVSSLPQTTLVGVLRNFDRDHRRFIIETLLPYSNERNSLSHDLITAVIESSKNVHDFAALVEDLDPSELLVSKTAGKDSWFRDTIILAEAVSKSKGIEYLPTSLIQNKDGAFEALGKIEDILKHNYEVVEDYSYDKPLQLPYAVNAERLWDEFKGLRTKLEFGDEFTFSLGELIELVDCWKEKIIIHTETGLGVFDSENYTLTSDELARIKAGVLKYPPSALIFRGIALNINFDKNRTCNLRALGGYRLGKVFLFDSIRNAVAGIDHPMDIDPFEYATIHELAHAAHTFCFESFKQLSDWRFVREGILLGLDNQEVEKIPDHLLFKGSVIEVNGEEFVVTDYQEPRKFTFDLGDEEIEVENVYDPDRCFWLCRKSEIFVSDVASYSPYEDYAEALATFLYEPEKLYKADYRKYTFMNYLYGPGKYED